MIFVPRTLVPLLLFINLKSYGFAYAASLAKSDNIGVITVVVDTEQDSDEILQNRGKRTVVTYVGKAASKATEVVENLLSNAKKLPKRSRCCDDFQKFGGYREAVRDFNILKPEGVNRFTLPRGVMGKSGEVGDRSVLVRSSGLDGKPVLEIIRRKEYMEKDNLEWSTNDPPIIRITYSKSQL